MIRLDFIISEIPCPCVVILIGHGRVRPTGSSAWGAVVIVVVGARYMCGNLRRSVFFRRQVPVPALRLLWVFAYLRAIARINNKFREEKFKSKLDRTKGRTYIAHLVAVLPDHLRVRHIDWFPEVSADRLQI
jgi:hypothetical protein